MQAMLLAAGLGTRLQPLTEELPKPAVPVANRPLAAFAIDHLARVGARTIVANTHPLPALVEAALQAYAPPSVDLRFSREETLLGTGGGLRRAWGYFPDPAAPVVVMNGDTLFAPALSEAYRQHGERDAMATMIVRSTPDPERYGAIGLDSENVVRSLLGAPVSANALRQFMFTGVHILSPRAFRDLPASGCVIRTAYRGWVDAGATVLAVVDDSPWADLGTPSAYHRVNLELASGARTWPGVMPVEGNLIAEGVSRDGAEVQESVIGADVELAPGASIERCVVWPGSRVTGRARNAVITPNQRVTLS